MVTISSTVLASSCNCFYVGGKLFSKEYLGGGMGIPCGGGVLGGIKGVGGGPLGPRGGGITATENTSL